MSPQVTIFELIEKDLEGATIVVGFPGVGLVGTIAANHLINSQGLEQIGVVESPHFPAVSVVKDGVPHNPVRIYAGEQTCIPKQVKGNDTCNQLVVCVSEFSPPAQLTKPLVTTLFEWIVEKGCKRLISAEGFRSADDDDIPDEVYGVGSTEDARKGIEEGGVKPFMFGTIGGVSGVMLNEGKRRNFNMLSLLAEVKEDIPDARAAARVIQVLDEKLLAIKLDPEPLLAEAKELEAQVRMMRDQAPPEASAETPRYIG